MPALTLPDIARRRQAVVPGTLDNPLFQSGAGNAAFGARDVPGSSDRNAFWNEDNGVAPYNAPGVEDDRVTRASSAIPPPPPGYTLKQQPSVPPPPAGYTLKSAAPAASPPATPEEPGLLTRMWHGLTGTDASKAGSFGMGVADPAVGSAQLGVRGNLGEDPILWSEGEQKAYQPPSQAQQVEAVDRGVQQRESRYEESQRQATPGINDPEVGITQPKLATDWMRLVGNVASPVNAITASAVPGGGAAVARGAPIAARLANAARAGAAQGAIGGASQPVSGGNFAGEKVAQVGAGAGLGAAVAPLMAAGGAAARSLGTGARNMIGRPALPAVAPGTQEIERRFQAAVPMSTRGITKAPDIADQAQNRVSAVQSIIADKDNLSFDTPKGTVAGRLPQTRMELSQAFAQVKDRLFQKYNTMTKETEGLADTGEPSPINKFNEAWDQARQRVSEAEQKAHTARTDHLLALADQHRAGENVYRSSATNAAERSSRAAVEKADQAVERARNQAEGALRNMRRPWVDLKPVVGELSRVANDGAMNLSDIGGSVVNYAKKAAEKYGAEEAVSPTQAQQIIKNFNASLEAFYNNPSYETAARASIDAMIANRMRQGLDELIAKTTGPGYQQLKNQYGALAALESDVAKAAVRAMGKTPEASLMDHLTSVTSAEEVLRGLTSLKLDPVSRGLLLRAGRMAQRMWDSPDRQVRLMFQNAERGMQPPAPRGRGGYLTSGAGGAGGDATERRPSVAAWP